MLLEGFLGITIFLLFFHYVRHWQKMLHCKERHVMITGCDSGFGNKLAKELDDLGVYVHAGCLLQSSVNRLVEECSDHLQAFCLDVCSQASIDNALKIVEKNLNGKALWAVVNNAGVSSPVLPFGWSKIEEYYRVFDVNFFGIVRITSTFLPLIKRGKEGRIVITSSFGGRFNIMSNAYSLSKCSVEALSDGLNFDLKPFNITVHVLEPGLFQTKLSSDCFNKKQILEIWDTLSQQMKEDYGLDYLKKKIAQGEKLQKHYASSKFTLVTNAFVHALFAKCPCNRYIVGWETMFLLPFTWLPFPVLLFVMPYVQKLTGLSEPLLKMK